MSQPVAEAQFLSSADPKLQERRLRVFLVLAGLFLATLAMLNILGISRFIALASWSESGGWAWGSWGEITFAVAVGVLPYPLTFFCTDLISEFYGRRRANFVVLVGLLVNLWVIFVLWVGGALPVVPEMVHYGTDAMGREVTGPPLPEPVYRADGSFKEFNDDWTYYRIQQLTFGAVAASMIAYLAAQFCDVYLFHFWKRLTGGRHIWLRNNGSTLVSQLVDTTAVILITHFYARGLRMSEAGSLWPQLLTYIGTGYAFKVVAALVDTGPIYLAVHWLSRYLKMDPVGDGAGQTTEARHDASA